MRRATGIVRAGYHAFWLADVAVVPEPFIGCGNGLVLTQPGIAIICTGISTGKVAVSVEVRNDPPEIVETADWEEVVEVSIEASTGRVTVVSPGFRRPDLPLITPDGPGHYRARVHAFGRDAAIDLAPFESAEDYLIVIWPAPPAPETVYKQVDRYGADLRRAAR
ncbi:MAG: hypothetical protein J2P30_07035 [Actinobacteria bacterium]|nr:hypothetical protein [Actinomycetota bacterium]